MGLKFKRKKEKNLYVSFAFLIKRFLPISLKSKMKLFLELEWAFDRVSHELSFQIFQTENHPVRTESLNTILKHIDNSSNVLDLGCSGGEISYLISKNAKTVTGLDHNKESIEIAKKKFSRSNLKFLQGDAFDYIKCQKPFSYDKLILSHILEHLENPDQFLIECKKHFKMIYIEVPDFEKTYLNIYRERLKSKLSYTDEDHIFEFDRAEIESLFIKTGLTIIYAEFRFGVQKYWVKS